MFKVIKAIFTLVWTLAIMPSNLMAQHIYVDGSVSINSPDGTISRPFPTVTQGIAAASPSDTIFVAAGLYTESLELTDNRGVLLFGGYAAGNFDQRDPSQHVTILRSNQNQAVIEIQYFGEPDNPQRYHIDGFTIEGGQRGIYARNFLSGGWPELIISNNIIRNNHGLTGSNDYGGGVSSAHMLLQLRQNLIQYNSSGKSAGLAVQLNSPDHGVLIEDNIIEHNEIHSDHGAGAGVQIYRGIIRRNVFRHNRILESYGWGGGLIIDGNRFDGFNDNVYIALSGNVYTHNEAPSGGGGLFIDEGANVRMYNELIVHNKSLSSRGGGLLVDGPRAGDEARTELYNTTIAYNTGADWNQGHAIYVEGESEVRVRNSILWNNASGDNTIDMYVEAGSSVYVAYTLYMTGSSGDGQIIIEDSFREDPLFANPSEGDFHEMSEGGRWDLLLQAWVEDLITSPAIDAGDPTSPFNHEPAPNGERVNMGAFGNTPYASKSWLSNPSVETIPMEPQTFRLLPAYPNPFNPATVIRYELAQSGEVLLAVYNALGQRIAVLHDGVRQAGEHKAVFDARQLSGGLYTYRLVFQGEAITGKMLFLK
jgi:hypothetical protein